MLINMLGSGCCCVVVVSKYISLSVSQSEQLLVVLVGLSMTVLSPPGPGYESCSELAAQTAPL